MPQEGRLWVNNSRCGSKTLVLHSLLKCARPSSVGEVLAILIQRAL